MSEAHIIRQRAERFVKEHPALARAIAEVVQETRVLDEGELVAGLTPSQARLFDFLLSYTDRYGISPSFPRFAIMLSSVVRMSRDCSAS